MSYRKPNGAMSNGQWVVRRPYALFIAHFALLMCAVSADAALCYVRAGAAGNGGGSDWTNAYTALPATLVRGDTYYIADGAYAGRTFNTPVFGTVLITLKKATSSDHGTETGWSSGFGDGVAAFDGIEFTTNYWVFDGQTGGGPGAWKTGFGFKVTRTTSYPVIFCNGAGNIVVRRVETQGAGDNGAPGGTGNDSFQVFGGNGPVTLSYAYLHDAGRTHFYAGGGGPLTAEYVYTGKHESVSAEHSELAVIRTSALFTFRWGVITHEEGTGGFIGAENTSTAEIYGNVFYNFNELAWATGNNGLIAGFTDSHVHNWKVYNNTFINLPSALTTFYGGNDPAGNTAQNNYFYLTPTHNTGGWGTESFDHFQNSGAATGTNGTTGSGDPFMDYPNGNFALKAPTAAGSLLAAPYNIDMVGNTRGADGVWDRGALEYGGVTPPPPPPPSGSACDINKDGSPTVADVQLCSNQAINVTACTTADINLDGNCTVVDVQRVVNAALGGPCVTP